MFCKRGELPRTKQLIPKSLQGNTVINSEPSQRHEAFSDVNVNVELKPNGGLPNGKPSAGTPPPAEKSGASQAGPQTDARPQGAQNGTPGKAPVTDSNWSDEQELALVSNSAPPPACSFTGMSTINLGKSLNCEVR